MEFSVAVFVLLVTPGPTNTLLLIAGSERGFARSLRLIPAELAGYLGTVLPLAVLGHMALTALPSLRVAVALAAGGWVAYLALRLWRLPVPGAQVRTITARTVLTTTLLNPKALIFGLVLLPSPDHLMENIAIFIGLVVIVAAGWAGLGAGLSATQGRGTAWPILPILRRVAAVWLAVISATLILKGLSA